VQTITEKRPGPFPSAGQAQRTSSESWTTRHERVLPPDRIARIPRGEALVMIGPWWSLLPTLPYHRHPTFAQLTPTATPAITVPA
jgi:hypothetical protein